MNPMFLDRLLEKRGEGVTLSVNTLVAEAAAVTPSPFASKLASSLRGEALPHQGGGGVAFPVFLTAASVPTLLD